MFTRTDFEAMTQSQLTYFIKLHSDRRYIESRIGTNPISPIELVLAKKIHKARNKAALKAALASKD